MPVHLCGKRDCSNVFNRLRSKSDFSGIPSTCMSPHGYVGPFTSLPTEARSLFLLRDKERTR